MGEMTAIRDAYGAALKELGEQDVRCGFLHKKRYIWKCVS